MDDHAPKETSAQHSNDQQSWSSQDCIWNQNQEEGELVHSCWMDNTQPVMHTTNSRGDSMWQR